MIASPALSSPALSSPARSSPALSTSSAFARVVATPATFLSHASAGRSAGRDSLMLTPSSTGGGVLHVIVAAQGLAPPSPPAPPAPPPDPPGLDF